MEEDKVGREFTFHQEQKSRGKVKKGEQSNIIPASIKCPECSFKGIVTDKKKDFKLLEKDENGCLYFECPKCKSHLKYDGLMGEITVQRRPKPKEGKGVKEIPGDSR